MDTMLAPAALRPFRHRTYRLLACSLIASLLSAGVLVVALVWQIVALGGGAAQLGQVTTSAAGGLVVSALVGGVLADRFPQRHLLIGAECVKAVAVGVCALVSLHGDLQVWHLVLAAAVGGIADGIYYPAYSAYLPALVPESDLLAANGLEGVFRPTLAMALGPALAATLVAALSPGAALAAAAGASLVAALCLLPLPVLAPGTRHPDSPGGVEEPREPTHVLRDFVDGFRYMIATPWLWATLGFACLAVLCIMGPLEVLIPFVVKDHGGGGPSEHAIVLGAFGIGGALGAFAVASRRLPRRYLTTMLVLWGVVGSVPLAVIGVTSWVWLMALAAFVVGAADSAAQVIWGTLLQRRVPAALLGRVSSLDFFVSLLLMPVSMALAVPVSQAIGLSATFVLAGSLPVLVAGLALVVARLPADEIAHPLDPEPVPAP